MLTCGLKTIKLVNLETEASQICTDSENEIWKRELKSSETCFEFTKLHCKLLGRLAAGENTCIETAYRTEVGLP